jgi:hypothetical protein
VLSKPFSGKSPLRMENRNVSAGFLQTPSQSQIATVLARRWQTYSLQPWQQDVAVFCIATTSPSKRRLHHARKNLFPDQVIMLSKSMVVVPLRFRSQVLRKPTYRKREQPQWSVLVGWSELSSSRQWHSALRLLPRLPEDVTCLSGYCFERQHSLSQPIF